MSAFGDWLLDHLDGAVAVTGGAGTVATIVFRRVMAALLRRREAERAELLAAIDGVTKRIEDSEARHEDRHERVTGRLDHLGREVSRVNARTHRLVSSVSHIKGRLGLQNGDHLIEAEVEAD